MKKSNGDVRWYLPPHPKTGKSKLIATSTKATSDLIALLYEKYGNLRLVYENIRYDEDAKRVVEEYLKYGVETNISIRY